MKKVMFTSQFTSQEAKSSEYILKIILDDEDISALSDMQKKIIFSCMQEYYVKEEIKKRTQWNLLNIYERSLKKLKSEWHVKLSKRYEMLPTSDEAFALLVFEQPDFKMPMR